MGSILRKRFDKLARTEHGTLHFIEDNAEDHIDAYWGGRKRWEALPDKLSEMQHFTNWDAVVPINHGGRLLSTEMNKGDWSGKLEFQCAFVKRSVKAFLTRSTPSESSR